MWNTPTQDPITDQDSILYRALLAVGVKSRKQASILLGIFSAVLIAITIFNLVNAVLPATDAEPQLFEEELLLLSELNYA